jgi:hypothetical protein
MYLSPSIITKTNLAVLTDDEIYLLLKTDVSEGRISEARIYEASAIRQLAKEAQYFIGDYEMLIISKNWLSFKIAARPVHQDTLQVQYYDTDNAIQTLDAENYYLEVHDDTIKIMFTSNPMPELYDRIDAVKVSFNAGVTDVEEIDALAKHAIMQNIAYWFDKPEAVNQRFETSFDRVINILRLCWI